MASDRWRTRRAVGWRAARPARADCVPGAHEPALHERRPVEKDRLVHHSDRASQHVSVRCAERLADAGVEPGAGSVGDSDDNALVGTINGLVRAGAIHRRSAWRRVKAVQFATRYGLDGVNTCLLGPIGNIPPAGADATDDAALGPMPIAASTRKPIRSR